MESSDETLRRTQDCHLSPLLAEFCRAFSTERGGLRGTAPGHSTNSATHRGIDRSNEARQCESDRGGTVLRFENAKFGGPRDRRTGGSAIAIRRGCKGSRRL